jgi:hypothetical protein
MNRSGFDLRAFGSVHYPEAASLAGGKSSGWLPGGITFDGLRDVLISTSRIIPALFTLAAFASCSMPIDQTASK